MSLDTAGFQRLCRACDLLCLASVMVDDQDKAMRFYTEVLSFIKKPGGVFTREPVAMGPVIPAVFSDTCGNLIQIYQPR